MNQKVAEWSTADVSKWLKENGFQPCYADLIAKKHQIDGKALLTLTENDLREPPIAIPVLGVVKRLAIKLRQLQTQNYEDFSSLSTWNKHAASQQANVILDHAVRADHERQQFRRTWADRLDSECSVQEEEAGPVYVNGRKSPRSLELQPEFVKLAVSFVYMFAVALLSAFVMAVVHDRVPDMKKYPPLPDIFLDNMPYVPWAFQMCEITGLLLLCIWCGVLFFHKHRFILMRRWFSLTGTVFLLRCFTMIITSLSVPGTHLQCEPKAYGDVYEKLYRAFIIWKGIGMSLQGVRTCGDYMFSGHTVVVTMFNFFITEYTPRRTPMLHTLTWVMNIFGIFFILAAHEHYSIDVFIAFYISSRLFLYYHSLANSQALLSPDRKRARVWFPLFSFFESQCNVIVPNEYEWPLPFPSVFVQYFKDARRKHS